MKIKSISSKRQARYDKILFAGQNITPVKITIIGNTPITDQLYLVHGKDAQGKKYATHCQLFPSDHFGLHALFKIT